jgi:hypothetical protein
VGFDESYLLLGKTIRGQSSVDQVKCVDFYSGIRVLVVDKVTFGWKMFSV